VNGGALPPASVNGQWYCAAGYTGNALSSLFYNTPLFGTSSTFQQPVSSPTAAIDTNEPSEGWPTILAGAGYLTAPWMTIGAMPTINSPLVCPDANSDTSTESYGHPVTRIDKQADVEFRWVSDRLHNSNYPNPPAGGTPAYLDTSYGINCTTAYDASVGGLNNGVPMQFYPLVDSGGNPHYLIHSRSMVRKSSQLVMLFDGRGVNCMSADANRITLRHSRNTLCNVLIFDGHAESVPWKNLPGQTQGSANTLTGSGSWLGAFLLTNLPGGNAPTWRLDQ